MTCVLQYQDAHNQEKHLTCNFHESLSFRLEHPRVEADVNDCYHGQKDVDNHLNGRLVKKNHSCEHEDGSPVEERYWVQSDT